MRIAQRSAYAMRLAREFYSGDSPPISSAKPEDEPLRVGWWTTNSQQESADSARHLGALKLYLELSRSSKIALPEYTFPALFDLDDASMRPDKGVIKVFLECGLIVPRMMKSQLVFDVTKEGEANLA